MISNETTTLHTTVCIRDQDTNCHRK